MFKIHKPFENCLFLEFEKQKHIAFTFCRVQEYYESDNLELRDKFFSFEKFIDQSTDDDGFIEYFACWSGFNIPGKVYEKWLVNTLQLTSYEIQMVDAVKANLDMTKPFYIIGALKGDKLTKKHEIAHALYNLSDEYAFSMDQLTQNLPKSVYKRLCKELMKVGYGENVLIDEIQAYMSTGTKRELTEDFNLDWEQIKTYVFKYRKVLREHDTSD